MTRRALVPLKLVVSLGLLAFLASRLDLTQLWDRYSSVRLGLLAVGIAFLSFQAGWSALKWRVILKADGAAARFLFLWKTYLIGNFISLFLPTSFGGDIYRVYAVRAMSKTLAKGASSVLFDRVTGLIALISIACVASLFLPDNRYAWGIAGLYAAFILSFVLITSDYVLRRLPEPKSRVARFPLKVLRSFNTYRRARWGLLGIVALAFVFQMNIVVINYFYAHALRIDVAFTKLLVIIPLVYLTEVLPISINGLGVRESAFVSAYVLIGRTAEEGLAVSLLVVTLRYLMGSVGGVLLLIDWVRELGRGREGAGVEGSGGGLEAAAASARAGGPVSGGSG